AGIRAARGEVIIFIDDDTSFGADFISHHLEAHGARVGAVQGRVIETGGRESEQPPWINRWIRFRGGNNCTSTGKTNNLTGCNFSLSREAIREVGFFDERYAGVAIHEDSDYALRVSAAGYALRFAPAACLVHHRATSGGVGAGGDTLFFDQSYYYNELIFAKKHFSRLAVWLYRLRLKRRGRRALAKLLVQAEHEADAALNRK
ncbi:MAG: glycosyltransferase family 2 protein, partial [Gammaproteobacteria bacterium]